jgi:hypothetical protein
LERFDISGTANDFAKFVHIPGFTVWVGGMFFCLHDVAPDRAYAPRNIATACAVGTRIRKILFLAFAAAPLPQGQLVRRLQVNIDTVVFKRNVLNHDVAVLERVGISLGVVSRFNFALS